MHFLKHSFVWLLSFSLLTSCVGYKLGASKPSHLQSVQSIAIPLIKNETLFPRAEALGTNAIVDALTRDGTYRMAPVDTADALLSATIKQITYSQVRSTRLDTLRSEELDMQVSIEWKLVGDKNVVIDQGTITGKSRLFVADNLQTARQNALPDALRKASEKLISQLAHGF